MRNIKICFYSLLAGTSLFWLLANLPIVNDLTFIAIRNYLVQYSGVVAMAAMSISMVLATRPNWAESFLGGLDKNYRLHKWLGISSLILAITHWLASNAPKWLGQLGLLESGKRPPRPDPETLSVIQQFMGSQRGNAELIGEWGFYLIVVLIALALLNRFPYRLFAKTHNSH